MIQQSTPIITDDDTTYYNDRTIELNPFDMYLSSIINCCKNVIPFLYEIAHLCFCITLKSVNIHSKSVNKKLEIVTLLKAVREFLIMILT